MEKLTEWKEKIEGRLRRIFEEVEAPPSLLEAMRYYPLQGGKRIRPLFLVAVAHALGGDEEDAISAGCALELVHNYSLVHDDLPSMDDDQVRRGLPTCHVKFGEALALLAGDALLTLAFEVLSSPSYFRTLTPEGRLKLSHVLSKKAGAGGMVGGQVLDVQGDSDLERVSLLKTGALFEASFIMGGVVAGREELLPKLERWGRKVGLLFQMVDDYLDKDGFYSKLGEGLKGEIERLYGELKEELPPWEEVGALLRSFVSKALT